MKIEQSYFDNLLEKYNVFAQLSLDSLKKDRKTYKPQFRELERSFANLMAETWNTKTNKFYSQLEWPKEWSPKKLRNIAKDILKLRSLCGLAHEGLCSYIVDDVANWKPKKYQNNDSDLLNTQETQSLTEPTESTLYAPINFFKEQSPHTTGIIIGIAATLLYFKTNFETVKHCFHGTKKIITLFWQQDISTIKTLITGENFNAGIQPMAANIGFAYLCGSFLNHVTSSSETNHAASISANVDLMKRVLTEHPTHKLTYDK